MTHGCGPFVSKEVGKSVKYQLKLPWKSVKKLRKMVGKVYISEKKSLKMKYFNPFHKEATERKLKKIAESQKTPMSPKDFVEYMRRNVELASKM